jgi:hypothetical protein
MRPSGAIAVMLMLMVTLAGCAARNGGDGVATANNGKPTATPSSQPPTNNEDAALKYAQCMRQHGMSWFPDPKPDGRMTVEVPKGQDKSKVDAAMEACKKYLPNGGNPEKMDPEALERARQMSKCMRDHGVPNFPDPNANGEIQLDGSKLGMGPGDPKFDAAERACAQYAPNGARTERKSAQG